MHTRPHVVPDAGLRVLAIGAHPDDLEIGAGALIAKACGEGHKVFMLILTDDPDCGTIRRGEAVSAAAELGLAPERVMFGGFADGYLRADRSSVSKVRAMAAGINPDVVITHTDADSHNDHAEAYRLAHASFRDIAFLHFSVHVSCEESRFGPQIFVEVAGQRAERKRRALAAHASQRSTIVRRDLSAHEATMGTYAGLLRCEAFELDFQAGAAQKAVAAMSLSESPFHRLWLPLVGDTGVTLLYPSISGKGTTDEAELHVNAGRDLIRDAFLRRWAARPFPLREMYANGSAAHPQALDGTVVLAGGPDVNRVVRDVYNRISATRWTVEPGADSTEGYVLDRHRNVRMHPELHHGTVLSDVGVISRIAHPLTDGEWMVCAAGVTALGTRAALAMLASPDSYAGFDLLLSEPAWGELLFTVGRTLDDIHAVDFQSADVDAAATRAALSA